MAYTVAPPGSPFGPENAFVRSSRPSILSSMDQVVGPHEHDYLPAKAMADGHTYDRETIAFLGISRLRGVGFQTLSGLGGRAGIARILEGGDVSEITKRVSPPPSTVADWADFSRKILALGDELAESLTRKRVRFLFADDAQFPPHWPAFRTICVLNGCSLRATYPYCRRQP